MAATLTPRAERRQWTDADTDIIVSMRREGHPDADIVAKLGCTDSAFWAQVHRLMKDRSLDLPRANRPDWGQPWTDERDTLLVKMRNENLLHDDEIAEVLGITVQKMRTRVDHLRDVGREVRSAKKGPKPGPRSKATTVPAAASRKTRVPSTPAKGATVKAVAAAASPPADRLTQVADMRRDLARRRHVSTDAADRAALGARLLDVIDVEEAYAAAALAAAAADSLYDRLQEA